MRQAKIPGFYPPAGRGKGSRRGSSDPGNCRPTYKAHLKIAFGTDAGVYPHGENAHEFELMVERNAAHVCAPGSGRSMPPSC